MTSRDPLQQLHRLDRSSSEFPDQVSNILYREEYRQCVTNLQSGDLKRFVDYLDEVRRMCRSFARRSSHRRFSILSILPVLLSEGACASLDTYAVLEQYYRPRTSFQPRFKISVVSPSPLEVLGISMKGPSTVQRFASSASGYTQRTVRRKPQKYAIDSITFPVYHR